MFPAIPAGASGRAAESGEQMSFGLLFALSVPQTGEVGVRDGTKGECWKKI